MAVISIPQPGHFIDKHCSWSPRPIAIGRERTFREILASPRSNRTAILGNGGLLILTESCGLALRAGKTAAGRRYPHPHNASQRSEERRVGKECRSRWA